MRPDDDVQELLDRSRIADTVYAYCDHVDSADVDAVLGLFTEDAVMDLGGGAVHRGRAELRDMFVDRFRLYSSTSFYCSGIRLVRYDGTTASITSQLQTLHDAVGLNRRMHLWGRFEDDVVKEGGTWKFARRLLRVAGVSHTTCGEVPRRFSRVHRSPVPTQ